jgi:hypothetical protein
MSNPFPVLLSALPDTTVMGRLYAYFSGHESSTGTRLVLIVGLAVLVHLTVKAIRHISEWLIHNPTEPWAAQWSLLRGIISGAADPTINFIGGLFHLKNPAAGQPQPRETILLVVGDQLRSQNADGNGWIAFRNPDRG